MKRIVRFALVLMLVVMAFSMSTSSVSANKRIYKAALSFENELHTVVGSTAKGSFRLGSNQDGSMHFVLSVRGLSGDVHGAHLHGPADTTQNASVILTLCGNPAPAAVSECMVVGDTLTVSGDIPSTLLASWGLSPATLTDWLEAGLVYVNVHTSLNPAGESRGQIIPQ